MVRGSSRKASGDCSPRGKKEEEEGHTLFPSSTIHIQTTVSTNSAEPSTSDERRHYSGSSKNQKQSGI